MSPPFRAEHVGSLLRPESLRNAHRALLSRRIDAAEFRAAQDAAIAEAVRMQESLGFRAVTDGEFRRVSYWAHFVDAIDGLTLAESRFSFRTDAGDRIPFIAATVTGPLKRTRGISTEEFGYLRGATRALPKITMPSPATFHFWHGGKRGWFGDMARIYQDEISALARMGCRYLQLDDVPFAMLCDPAIRDGVKKPNKLVREYVELTNACIAGRPADMTVALHLCRGNFKGAHLSQGGYDEVAEAVFGGLEVDGYFLEYDTERAGGFAPLCHMPAAKSVVLGLISSKTAALENRRTLASRIDEAARIVPLEWLGLSPQCGFASAVTGNPVTEADQAAKLRLVVEIARDIWGRDVNVSRAEATRAAWLDAMARHRHDEHRAGGERLWSPRLDAASADELRAMQDDKIAAVAPFLYENSPFYRRRFDRLGLAPTDLKSVDDLIAKWPVLDKTEMSEDAGANPPYGTYTTVSEELWAERGWMMFSSSGSTGVPRIFRYTQHDREVWAWTNARALTAMDFKRGDTVFMITGYGPHVWAWGVQQGLAKMGIPIIPGGGMTAQMRANIVLRYKPTILLCTPSYALHLARVMQEMGHDPAATTVRQLFVAGEPGMSVEATRARIQALWGARMVEFYGCTECSAHAGGYSCAALPQEGAGVFAHLMEDVQFWEVVDPETRRSLPDGERGLTVCTNLNSESSPQLRFLVGDYTVFERGLCGCGRTHVRAMGSFCGRADDLINLRGIKMFPVDIEDALRNVTGVGDEFEIVLSTTDAGLDVMTVRCEHADASIAPKIAAEIRSRIEVRVDVEVLTQGTLPKTEFKARRVKDQRNNR